MDRVYRRLVTPKRPFARPTRLRLLLSGLLLLGAGQAQAIEGFWSLQLENDLFGSGDDQFYSHGTEISYFRPGEPPAWLATVARDLPFFELGETQAVQFSLGHKIYTPEDKQATVLLPDDRPYVGWLFGNAELLSRFATTSSSQASNLVGVTLGVVGPAALGEEIQNGWPTAV